MKSLFLDYISTYPLLGYVLLSFAMLIEGDIGIFASGFLVQQGFLHLPETLGVIIIGTFFGDSLWYSWGIHLQQKKNKIAHWVERVAGSFDQQILTHPRRTMLLTKFMYGIHRAILLRNGMLNVSKKQFWRSDIFAAIIWICVIGGVAYGASSSLLLFTKKYLKFVEIALGIWLILFIGVEQFLTSLLRKKLSDTQDK